MIPSAFLVYQIMHLIGNGGMNKKKEKEKDDIGLTSYFYRRMSHGVIV